MFSFQKDTFFISIRECHPIEKTDFEVPRYSVSDSPLLPSDSPLRVVCSSFSSGSLPQRTGCVGGCLDEAELLGRVEPQGPCLADPSEGSAPNGPVMPEFVGLTGSWLLRLKNGFLHDCFSSLSSANGGITGLNHSQSMKKMFYLEWDFCHKQWCQTVALPAAEWLHELGGIEWFSHEIWCQSSARQPSASWIRNYVTSQKNIAWGCSDLLHAVGHAQNSHQQNKSSTGQAHAIARDRSKCRLTEVVNVHSILKANLLNKHQEITINISICETFVQLSLMFCFANHGSMRAADAPLVQHGKPKTCSCSFPSIKRPAFSDLRCWFQLDDGYPKDVNLEMVHKLSIQLFIYIYIHKYVYRYIEFKVEHRK